MSITFDDLGDDVVEIIIGYVKHYNSLALLKRTCLRNYNHISRYSIAKLMLSNRLGLFSLRTYCANTNCTKTTEEVDLNPTSQYINKLAAQIGRYIHKF